MSDAGGGDRDGDIHAGGHFADAMGMEILRAADGVSEIRMTVREDMVNGAGICHGGAVFALADTAVGTAAWSIGRKQIAQQALINWILPARLGDVLTAEARVICHQGRTALQDAVVRNADGVEIAFLRGQSRQATV